MNKTLNCILLVDDNKFDNHYHEKIIQKNIAVATVIVRDSGSDAIEFLESVAPGDDNYPDLILLDINMHGMNGWDVLDEFKALTNLQKNIKIFMLTTSIDRDDETKARSYSSVFDFIIKPLKINDLIDSVNKHF